MFCHVKQLQYTARAAEPDPGLASLLLEQFGDPQSELAVARRYFTQGLGNGDPGHKDMLMGIATEELSHLEITGTLAGMLNKGTRGVLMEGTESETESHRLLTANDNNSHITSLLYGSGPLLTNSAGVPQTAAYINITGEPVTDLWLNVAAGMGAKIVYERLINVTNDPEAKDALVFLVAHKAAHQFSSEKALQSICNSYPPDKLPPISEYANTHCNMSEDGEVHGNWNSNKYFDYVKDPQPTVDGGDGSTTVGPASEQETLCKAMLK